MLDKNGNPFFVVRLRRYRGLSGYMGFDDRFICHHFVLSQADATKFYSTEEARIASLPFYKVGYYCDIISSSELD